MLEFGWNFTEQQGKSVSELWNVIDTEECQRLSKLIRKHFVEAMVSFPGGIPAITVDTQEYLDRYFSASENRVPVLHLLHYWAVKSGRSCHEIMYGGGSHTVSLFGEARYVVERMAHLPPDRRTELLEYLSANRFEITNPVYTHYRRNQDLAGEKCLTTYQFWLQCIPMTNNFMYGAISRFFDQELYPNQKLEKGNKHWLTSPQTAWFLDLLLCPSMNICLDYFIMQDYSQFAILDGEVLTEEQRAWLSAFLMASEQAQRTALSNLILL